ncbi:Hypothetical predicted protein [Olea europaea subsp. europaea]|uniref:Uncharacterized protein n=1 Tax=Olea europaea subsp. europaea TaxID=158383 RepID=A0A8S0V0H3_OLEEU|nr:Hypothetical predicted protein [Olea europaea subsp. europaea]
MGLETLPDSVVVGNTNSRFNFSRSPRKWIYRNQSNCVVPQSYGKSLVRNPDSIMKHVSRFSIESTLKKQIDMTRLSQKPASRRMRGSAEAPNTYPSVYSEIEKRLKDLEFAHSGKDLRAFKHILEAMQAKGLLETQKE